MCGIAGCWQVDGSDRGTLSSTVNAMAQQVSHRGPDDSGVWLDSARGIGLGHRRLAILDLSAEGHQPMFSSGGRYVIVFNGEIYNFAQLRAELEKAGAAPPWRGKSDTEVLLAAIVHWGLKHSLTRCTGMFAFALWDRMEGGLYLARDRLGEKPLYYGWAGGVLLFASELKALRIHPAWQGDVDRDALAQFMRFGYVPTPYSIYKGIRKLPAGAVGSFQNPIPGLLPQPQTYWSVADTVEQGRKQPFGPHPDAAINELDALLRAAIKDQMVADVPLGALLSGGVDSSTVVALMQAQSARPVKTFSIGFHEPGYDEAQHAKAVAQHLGTEHTELYVTPAEAMAVIPKLPSLYDEPFGDSSQIPTHLVCQLARQEVTVSLSGDGGDELFGGYNRYVWGEKIWSATGWLPGRARRNLGQALMTISPAAWDRIFAMLRPILPKSLRINAAGDKVHKLADTIGAQSVHALYMALVSQWTLPLSLVRDAKDVDISDVGATEWAGVKGCAEHMMYLDAVSYLPDDILVKVDRASMGASLETRAPFLDHRVVEFAWRVPMSMKIRDGKGKWLLRQLLNRYIPRVLVQRPKMGFGMPIDSWLRGPLRNWADELINSDRIHHEGYLSAEQVHRKWDEHLSGRRNWQHLLWNVLMFQAWLEATRPKAV